MIEIVIWNIGGQGGVLAMDIILESLSKKWINSQGFPQFGAERRGAPVQISIRAAKGDENPPRCPIEEPDCVVIFDVSLLKKPKARESISNLKPNGLLLINTPKEPSHFKGFFKGRIVAIDATAIALGLGIGDKTTPFVNTAMAGAITGILEFDLELLCASVQEKLGNKAEINIQAIKQGYREVR
jgi:2-oxoacid:acceptor oxidoreductase gamma subunit (pyruvate/2-ketoisovalerate family)